MSGGKIRGAGVKSLQASPAARYQACRALRVDGLGAGCRRREKDFPGVLGCRFAVCDQIATYLSAPGTEEHIGMH